ncbi:conserved hypothetical protein [Ricinus communis]|uniref:Uncharacterized protein n=1 Tax=Ricinus communis TaxID=3988 RepID=B9T0B0_RICCO|nr:conserved hypothetical protein [Ricinus communis]
MVAGGKGEETVGAGVGGSRIEVYLPFWPNLITIAANPFISIVLTASWPQTTVVEEEAAKEDDFRKEIHQEHFHNFSPSIGL